MDNSLEFKLRLCNLPLGGEIRVYTPEYHLKKLLGTAIRATEAVTVAYGFLYRVRREANKRRYYIVITRLPGISDSFKKCYHEVDPPVIPTTHPFRYKRGHLYKHLLRLPVGGSIHIPNPSPEQVSIYKYMCGYVLNSFQRYFEFGSVDGNLLITRSA